MAMTYVCDLCHTPLHGEAEAAAHDCEQHVSLASLRAEMADDLPDGVTVEDLLAKSWQQ